MGSSLTEQCCHKRQYNGMNTIHRTPGHTIFLLQPIFVLFLIWLGGQIVCLLHSFVYLYNGVNTVHWTSGQTVLLGQPIFVCLLSSLGGHIVLLLHSFIILYNSVNTVHRTSGKTVLLCRPIFVCLLIWPSKWIFFAQSKFFIQIFAQRNVLKML